MHMQIPATVALLSLQFINSWVDTVPCEGGMHD